MYVSPKGKLRRQQTLKERAFARKSEQKKRKIEQ